MKNLKALRKAHGLTQAQLGESLGITNVTISRWESGERTPPIKTIARLAEILQCEVSDLLE